MHDPADYVHAAAAHRTDPDAWEPLTLSLAEVPGLAVTLRLTPDGPYTVEVKAALLVIAPPGSRLWLAPYLIRGCRCRRAAWHEHVMADATMIRVERAFAGIAGEGPLIEVGLAVKADTEHASTSAGYLSALAVATPPIAVLPGIGPVLTLAP